MIPATSTPQRTITDFDLQDLIPLSQIAAELKRDMETMRRWWAYGGLPTVKIGRTRYTTRAEMRRWILSQSGAAGEVVSAPAETPRARRAELARVDRELQAAGI